MVGATSTRRPTRGTRPSLRTPFPAIDERRPRLHDAERAVLAPMAALVLPVVRGGVQHAEVGRRRMVEELRDVVVGERVRVGVARRDGGRRSSAVRPTSRSGDWSATGSCARHAGPHVARRRASPTRRNSTASVGARRLVRVGRRAPAPPCRRSVRAAGPAARRARHRGWTRRQGSDRRPSASRVGQSGTTLQIPPPPPSPSVTTYRLPSGPSTGTRSRWRIASVDAAGCVRPVPGPSRLITSMRWPTDGLPSRQATASAPFHVFHCAPTRNVPPDGATVTPPETQVGSSGRPGAGHGLGLVVAAGAVVRVPTRVAAVHELVDLVVHVGPVLDRVRVVAPRAEGDALGVAVTLRVPELPGGVAGPRGAVGGHPEDLAAEGVVVLRRGRGPGVTGRHEERAGPRLEPHPAAVVEARVVRDPLDDDRPVGDRRRGARVQVEPCHPVVGRGRVADVGAEVPGAVRGVDRQAHEAALAGGAEPAVEARDPPERVVTVAVAEAGRDLTGVVLGVDGQAGREEGEVPCPREAVDPDRGDQPRRAGLGGAEATGDQEGARGDEADQEHPGATARAVGAAGASGGGATHGTSSDVGLGGDIGSSGEGLKLVAGPPAPAARLRLPRRPAAD